MDSSLGEEMSIHLQKLLIKAQPKGRDHYTLATRLAKATTR